MTRRLLPAAVALAALLAGGRASALAPVSGSLDLGVGYLRHDSWSDDGAHRAFPMWDFDLSGSASGGPLDPGILQWRADGDYRPTRGLGPINGRRVDNLGYRLQLHALEKLPASVSAYASRVHTDFTTELARDTPGTAITNAAGGEISLQPASNLPHARAAIARVDTETRNPAAEPTLHGSTALRLGLGQSIERLQYGADYETSWNEGTYAESNFRFHFLNLQGQAKPTEELQARVSQHYYLREPTRDGPTNPRVDDGRTGLGVHWRSRGKLDSSAEYSYARSLIDIPDDELREQRLHNLRLASWYRRSEELRFQGNVVASWATARLGEVEQSAAGQTLGADVLWQRERKTVQYMAGGGLSAGVVEPDTGGVDGSYGVSASGGLGWQLPLLRANANYSGYYTKGSVQARGYVLGQRLQLGAEGLTARALAWRARIDLNYDLRSDELLGAYRNRGAVLTVDAGRGRWSTRAGAGITDGLNESLAPRPEGNLLLPESLNTVSRYAYGSATAFLLGRNLTLTALLRTAFVSAPGRLDEDEQSAHLMLGYRVGQLTFSLEERYSTASAGESRRAGNLLYARVSRAFGGSF